MATITNSIGTSGRDYSTIAAWAAALPGNLVTDGNSYVGECYNDSTFTEGALALSGHTTDATHTITLKCASGQSFSDNANRLTNALRYNTANGVSWGGAASYGTLFNVGDDYVTVNGIQFKETSNNAAPSFRFTGAHNGITQCIFQSTPRGNSQVVRCDAGPILNNCLIVCTQAPSWGGEAVLLIFVATMTESTVVCPSDIGPNKTGVASVYGSSIAINCAVFGFSTAFGSGFSGSSGFNCTDSASAPGSSNQTSKTYANQFQNTADATADFRLKTGADCIDNGTTDTTYNPGAIDIVGTSRPQGTAWDIGCWELVVAATYKSRLIRWRNA